MTVKEFYRFLDEIGQDVKIFKGGDMGISPLILSDLALDKESSHFFTPPEGVKAGETILIIN